MLPRLQYDRVNQEAHHLEGRTLNNLECLGPTEAPDEEGGEPAGNWQGDRPS